MKKFLAVPLAVFFVAACSESSTAPASSNSDLAASFGKKTTPVAVCSSCPIVGNFDFEGGIGTSDGTSTVSTDIQPGIVSAQDGPNVVDAPTGESFLGRFTNTRTMVVINTPGAANYNLTFDLYIIGSWDGRGKQAQQGIFQANVVDIGYRCSASGDITSLFKTTFSNQYTVQQDYPNSYLTGGYKAGTGAEAIDDLGYAGHQELSNTPQFRSFGDATYTMNFSGANQCNGGDMTFTISTSNPTQQSAWDESWGVDNIVVRAGT